MPIHPMGVVVVTRYQRPDKGKRIVACTQVDSCEQMDNGSGTEGVHFNSRNQDYGVNLSSEQVTQIMSILNNMQFNSRGGANNGTNLGTVPSDFVGMMACSSHNSSNTCICLNCMINVDSPWIIDSGATDHMCNDLSLFTHVKHMPSPFQVTLPNGHFIEVNTVGTIPINDIISLYNVMYVPSFKYNLISVTKLLQQNKCSIQFTYTDCTLQGLS